MKRVFVLPQIVVSADTFITPMPTQAIPKSKDWNKFVDSAKRISAIYNFPAKVVIAQAALESAHGTSEYAEQRHNFIGIGAYDDTPDDAYTFENADQCLIEYMRIIRQNFPEAWANRDNAELVLQLLKENSYGLQYATDPDYISKVTSMEEWGIYGN